MIAYYQRFKGNEPVFWFSELKADCSFMWSVSLICSLNFTLSLSKISSHTSCPYALFQPNRHNFRDIELKFCILS